MINPFLLVLFISMIAVSCGPTEEEIKEREAFVADSIKRINEEIRIHNEKIEVGKQLRQNWIKNMIEEIDTELRHANNRLKEIDDFVIGRSLSTKKRQLREQRETISTLKTTKANLQTELAKTNLFKSFDFQCTPEGTINYLFEAAKSNDFSKLRHIGDPYGELGEGLYELTTIEAFPSEVQNEFVNILSEGRIMGEPIINQDTAVIEIAVGYNSDRLNKVKLIKRRKHWYLLSLVM
ncbi:hypothetical protein MATR_00450 [Marivirga tractuosa]|uniref:Uncharacterized protein n=1 Tax=Marivirga tractuosa (strain ATCC 23168 / DSM 4126 / NBRC 15989 / NCIMB 1408 / VKM B-1430 / H-43) TaxID=643867 RepID=E4TLK9_MARTH|nr:hypothetical protein [Marivirga tractuosa]ADR22313.1 hypothetical protein Ftrac_2335 [Marivirga tractuosa DSM 4126]BDD13220.1 hypothetical protein MATR_00450 [Marivirga tractuosa]